MKMKWLLLLLLLSGCTQHSLELNGLCAVDGLSAQYPIDARQLADSAAAELSRRYAPAQDRLALLRVPGEFGASLEQGLRIRGFAVLPNPAGLSPGVTVGAVANVVLQEKLEPLGYAEVRTSDGHSFSLVRRLGRMPALSAAKPSSEPVSVASLTPVSHSPVTIPVVKTFTPEKEAAKKDSEHIMKQTPAPAVPDTSRSSVKLFAGVLASLPYDWKYTIPDPALRPVRVYPVKKGNWRENILCMVQQARAQAVFDERGKRVTVRAHPCASVSITATTIDAVPDSTVSKPVLLHPKKQESNQAQTKKIVSVPVPAANSTAPKTRATNSTAAVSSPASMAPLITEDMADAKTVVADTKSVAALASLESTPQVWSLIPGSLKNQLEEWASRAGYQLVWKSEADLYMDSHAQFRGAFLESIQKLFMGLHRAGHPLRITNYQANKVLEVNEK